MSLKRKIAHNTLVQIIGKLLSTILGFIAIIMLGRYLGPEQYGWYITTISFLQFIGILIDFGLIPVTAQMLSEPTFDKRTLLNNLLSFRIVTALACFGIAPFIVLFFPYPPLVKTAIAFTTISFISIAINQIFTGYYQTVLRMHVQAIADVVSRAILIGGLAGFMMYHTSFIPIMMWLVVANLSMTFFLWYAARSDVHLRFSYDKAIWKAIIQKMWPIAISITFNVVYLRGDVILLPFFRSQTEVGLYGMGYRVLDIVSQTAMMLMGIMLPILTYAWSRNSTEEFKKYYQQSFISMMMIGIPVTVGTILLATPIMTLVGPEYAPAGNVLQILALAVFGVYLGAIFGHTAVAINRQKQTVWIYLSDAILTLIGYLIFIPRYGMYGAAWMTVFSEMYAGVCLFFTIRYYSGERLPFIPLAKILVSAGGMALALYLLRDLHVLLLAPIGVLVYALIAYGTGAVSRETVRDIFRIRSTSV